MQASNYLEQAFLNTLRNQNLNAPNKVYLGLFLSNPGEAGAGLEVTYQAYKRMEINFSAPAKIGSNTEISVAEDIKFAESNKTLGTITHIAIFDSLTGGNCLAYGELTEELTITAGESPSIFQGDLKVYMTGADGLSDAYRAKLLNVFRAQSIPGFNSYLALYTGNPDAGGIELTGNSYGRKPVQFSAPEQAATGQALIKNSQKIKFNKPTSSWGNWAETVIMDAETNGNVVYKKAHEAKELKKGYVPYFEANAIQVMIN